MWTRLDTSPGERIVLQVVVPLSMRGFGGKAIVPRHEADNGQFEQRQEDEQHSGEHPRV